MISGWFYQFKLLFEHFTVIKNWIFAKNKKNVEIKNLQEKVNKNINANRIYIFCNCNCTHSVCTVSWFKAILSSHFTVYMIDKYWTVNI